MDRNKSALERAFELAKSGNFASLSAIKSALMAERYSVDTVIGPSLSKQLRDLIASSREQAPPLISFNEDIGEAAPAFVPKVITG